MQKQDRAKLKDDAAEVLFNNRRTTNGYQYTMPSPGSYPYQWLWDSCFHAIALAKLNPEDAKKELLSLVSHQFGNGLIPHMIYWERVDGIIDIAWGRGDTSSITQPPMLAYAAWRIYEADGDRAFLEKIYPSLYHFYTYLLTDRDPRRNHLAGIINPDESGEDDSPRFDSGLGLPPQHTLDENFTRRKGLVEKNKTCDFDAPFCMKQFFWVKDVPFNAILVKNLSILGRIAEVIGRMDESLHFRDQELRVSDAMRDRMLEDGIFWSLSGESYDKIYVKTWAIFAPLFARILSQDEANRLVEQHLKNPHEFGTRFSVPSVAKDDPSFNADGFWRGPVWAATNWFIYRGLKGYGFDEEAERIAEDTARLHLESGFRERFNPETGIGIGAKEFTWGSLLLDMGYDE